MAVRTQPKRAALVRLPSHELGLVEARRRAARLHLFTYIVGNALFWALWAAVYVAADRWYWWLVTPSAGWTLVLALHLWHAYRRPRPPA